MNGEKKKVLIIGGGLVALCGLTLFLTLLQMAGELATFTDPRRRPSRYESYRHDDLQRSLAPVVADIRRSLSAVLEQTAIPIPLQERRHGVR